MTVAWGMPLPKACVLAPLLLASMSCFAQQPAAPAPAFGAMLKLPDITCRVPEPHMLEQFALTVQREIAQQSKPDDYPAEALRQRLSGTVYVKLSYGAYADHPRIDVDRSSGWPLLDESALALAKRSTLQRPEPVRCRSLTVSFPLRFRIAPAGAVPSL